VPCRPWLAMCSDVPLATVVVAVIYSLYSFIRPCAKMYSYG
jgi:hypothetical protein